MQKKYLIILLGVVLVVIVLILLKQKNPKQPAQTQTQQTQAPKVIPAAKQVPAKVTTTEVPKDQSPEQFPSDIPIEKNAVITQNYNATSDSGSLQATRVFVTAKTLADNLKLYTAYLKDSGWTINNSLDLPTTKVLSATKGSDNLQITISQNTVTKVNTVNISYSSQK